MEGRAEGGDALSPQPLLSAPCCARSCPFGGAGGEGLLDLTWALHSAGKQKSMERTQVAFFPVSSRNKMAAAPLPPSLLSKELSPDSFTTGLCFRHQNVCPRIGEVSYMCFSVMFPF